MAVVYFTNNASTGSGSLGAAVAAAKDGDVIRPDESVFERGSTIEIALASRLDVRKTLTIDGGACRIRLNGGSSVVCLYVREGDATFINVDIVAGRSASSSSFYPGGVRVDASATFKRCRIAGCESQTTGGAMLIASSGVANLDDCLVVGNLSAAGYGGLAVSGVANVAGSTLVGNVAATGANDVGGGGTVDLANAIVGVNTTEKTTSLGSVVNVAPSQIGFVASPPDDLTVDNWSADAWENWDLRLLDDASPNPSPCRDSGDVDAASKYDLDGNFRGRETNGVATCSPGAYETLQADLFWIGADATGTEVVLPSFLTSNGWATSRFAIVSGDVAPQVGQKLFVGSEAVFVDTPAQGSSLNIGGYAVVSTGTGGTEPIALTVGFGAIFTISTSVILQRIGGFVEFNWTSGNVTVNTDLTMSELSIPSGASITVNGALVSIETFRVNNSSTVVFSSVDAVLAATETATVGAATFTGTGYFATPPGTDTNSASFAETVRNCDYGANVSSFSASPNTATTALLSWVKQNLTPSVLIEEANGSAWSVVSNRATGDSLSVDISAPKTFRLFDGENFFTASARPYGTAYELAEEQTIGYLKTLISTGYLN